jgi:multiple sugar transport system permease protein
MIRRLWRVRTVGVAAIILWSLIPIYWAINTSFQREVDAQAQPAHYFPSHPTLHNYQTLLTDPTYAGAIRRSTVNIFIECGAATALVVAIGTLAAFAFARMTFKLRKTLFFCVLLTMAFPAYTTLIPLYKAMSDVRLINTYTGLVLPAVAGFLPLATWILYNYFSSLPAALEEAARCDGANRLQVLRRIVLPLAVPGIASTTIITFLFAWGQFLFPLVLSSDLSTEPLTVTIASFETRNFTPFALLNAAGVLTMLVPGVIALLMNRYIVSGLLAGSSR